MLKKERSDAVIFAGREGKPSGNVRARTLSARRESREHAHTRTTGGDDADAI